MQPHKALTAQPLLWAGVTAGQSNGIVFSEWHWLTTKLATGQISYNNPWFQEISFNHSLSIGCHALTIYQHSGFLVIEQNILYEQGPSTSLGIPPFWVYRATRSQIKKYITSFMIIVRRKKAFYCVIDQICSLSCPGTISVLFSCNLIGVDRRSRHSSLSRNKSLFKQMAAESRTTRLPVEHPSPR